MAIDPKYLSVIQNSGGMVLPDGRIWLPSMASVPGSRYDSFGNDISADDPVLQGYAGRFGGAQALLHKPGTSGAGPEALNGGYALPGDTEFYERDTADHHPGELLKGALFVAGATGAGLGLTGAGMGIEGATAAGASEAPVLLAEGGGTLSDAPSAAAGTLGGEAAAGGAAAADTEMTVAQRLIENGVAPGQAVQMAGVTPAAAEAAGLTPGAGLTWQGVASQYGIPYGGPLITGAAIVEAAKKAAPTLAVSALAGGALKSGAKALSGSGLDGSDSGFATAQQAEESRKADLRSKINRIYGIDDGSDESKAARTQMDQEESQLSNATRGFYDDQLKHDTERAFRRNRFALADRGLLGGSAQIDTERELGRDNEIGATRIADQVSNALAGLRSGRESERLNAINLVNAGSGEDAVAGAQAGLSRSLQNAQATQHANLTGDLFTAGADAVAPAGSAFNPALLSAYQNRLSTFFNPSGRGGGARITSTGT